jgi:hypothetical protein
LVGFLWRQRLFLHEKSAGISRPRAGGECGKDRGIRAVSFACRVFCLPRLWSPAFGRLPAVSLSRQFNVARQSGVGNDMRQSQFTHHLKRNLDQCSN